MIATAIFLTKKGDEFIEKYTLYKTFIDFINDYNNTEIKLNNSIQKDLDNNIEKLSVTGILKEEKVGHVCFVNAFWKGIKNNLYNEKNYDQMKDDFIEAYINDRSGMKIICNL